MTLADYKEAVETGIVNWFDNEKRLAPTVESNLLLDRMCALIKRGGKRARPELLYMTYIAYEGKNPASLIDLGLALEFHHQFLLIHDDIIDRDIVRYDGPNIVGYYLKNNEPDISEAMGLLAGDLLFSFSNQAIINSRYIEKQKIKLLKLLNKASIDVVYGQQLDTFNLDPASVSFTEKLLLIHSLKSSSYSTQLPMECAATLLNLTASERKKVMAFARPFGVLFQLVDDYSDYFTNDSVFNNRPKYRDFRQGKITYPLYTALNLANKKQVGYINQNLGNKDLPIEEINNVVSILEGCGAKKASSDYLDQFFIQAFDAMEKLSISPKQKQQFTRLVEKYRV